MKPCEITFTSPINLDDGYKNHRLHDSAKSTMQLYVDSDNPCSGEVEWIVEDGGEIVEHIGLWTDEAGNLTDYDGVFELPPQIKDLFRRAGITADESFFS